MALGGQSGAPVLLLENHTRDPIVNDAYPPAYRTVSGGRPRRVAITDADVDVPLLGLLSSDWKIQAEIRNLSRRNLVANVHLTSGIATVVPTWYIMNFLVTDPRLQKDRRALGRFDGVPVSSNESKVQS